METKITWKLSADRQATLEPNHSEVKIGKFSNLKSFGELNLGTSFSRSNLTPKRIPSSVTYVY